MTLTYSPQATAPALGVENVALQTPDWDKHQKELLKAADPDVDTTEMTPKELILTTEVHDLEAVVKRLKEENKQLAAQAKADREDWDKMHAQCTKYAEENHRVLELLGQHDARVAARQRRDHALTVVELEAV